MFDPEKFGRAVGEQIKAAVSPLQKQITALQDENAALKKQLADLPDIQAIVDERMSVAVAAIPTPTNGKDCDMDAVMVSLQELVKAIPAPKDGTGMAGAILDRDGCLQITLTNGEVKNLGVVVGKDGLSFESFTSEYIPETNEISLKGTCAGRTQEIRYPAGGIRPAGYWRDGTKAKAGEAWVHDGQTYYAKQDTTAKPETKSDDWILDARRGRDFDPTVTIPKGTIKVG